MGKGQAELATHRASVIDGGRAFTSASLFSGCGGFDLGLEKEGFQSIAGFDIDPHAVAAYNSNLRAVARRTDLSIEQPDIATPDVLIAGSPCQGFSTSGKRLESDPRNQLLVRAGQIALKLRPKAVVIENVPTAIGGNPRGHWQVTEELLKWHGYNVRRYLAEGSQSGVAQVRKRMFLIAWRGSEHRNLELPQSNGQILGDVLNGVALLPDHLPVQLPKGSRERRIAIRIPPGKKLSNVRISANSIHTWDIPEVFGQISASERIVLQALVRLRRRNRRRAFGDADPVRISTISQEVGRAARQDVENLVVKNYIRRTGDGHVDLTHTYNGKFKRLCLDGLSPTVDTHFGDPCLFLHPSEHRGFTHREAARIQGFPDWFHWSGSKNVRFRLIGNAVPPPMGSRVAAFVRDALLK